MTAVDVLPDTITIHLPAVPTWVLSDVFAAVAEVAARHGMRSVLVSVGDGVTVQLVQL